jgi:hypothetical protein
VRITDLPSDKHFSNTNLAFLSRESPTSALDSVDNLVYIIHMFPDICTYARILRQSICWFCTIPWSLSPFDCDVINESPAYSGSNFLLQYFIHCGLVYCDSISVALR